MPHAPEATYGHDPEDNDIDRVRLALGDTDCETVGNALLTDSEIQFRINAEASLDKAAWRSCQDIVSRLTRDSHDFGAGTQRESKSQTLEHYRALADDLKRRGGSEFVAMRVGGISKSEKLTNERDEDVVQGVFKRNLLRNPRRGSEQDETTSREGFD